MCLGPTWASLAKPRACKALSCVCQSVLWGRACAHGNNIGMPLLGNLKIRVTESTQFLNGVAQGILVHCLFLGGLRLLALNGSQISIIQWARESISNWEVINELFTIRSRFESISNWEVRVQGADLKWTRDWMGSARLSIKTKTLDLGFWFKHGLVEKMWKTNHKNHFL